jgi:hypothetical protein
MIIFESFFTIFVSIFEADGAVEKIYTQTTITKFNLVEIAQFSEISLLNCHRNTTSS